MLTTICNRQGIGLCCANEDQEGGGGAGGQEMCQIIFSIDMIIYVVAPEKESQELRKF